MGPIALVTALALARPYSEASEWERFALSLDPDARAQLRERLRAELATEELRAPGTCRALEVLGDDDEVVQSRAAGLVGLGPTPPMCPGHAEGIFAAMEPDAAFALACAGLEEAGEGSPVGHILPALHVVAASDRVCDVRDWLEWMRCYPGLRCGDVLCTDPEAITPGPEAEIDADIVGGYRDVLRVALRSGPLPAEWVAREGCGD